MCQIENIKEIGIKEPFSLKIEQLLLNTLIKLKIPQFIRNIRRFKTIITTSYWGRRRKKSLRDESLKDTIDLSSLSLKQGDVVRIRSKDQILQTLDKNNKLDGCSFMKEMWQYCRSQQTVIKKVDYFFDEGSYRMRKARNIVLLEGLYCSGKFPIFKHRCDRLCFFFWKNEWLEKIE